MSATLEVWTSHRDVSEVVRELAPFVDDTSVRLPAGRRIADGDWIRFSVHLLDGSRVFEGVGRCQESTQEGASTYRVRLSLLSFDDELNEIMWERMLLAREDGVQATGDFDLRGLREKILKPAPSAPSKSVPPPPPRAARVEPARPPTLRPRPPAGRPPLPPLKPSNRPPPPEPFARPATIPRPSSFPPPRPSSFPPPRASSFPPPMKRPIEPAAPPPKLEARPRLQPVARPIAAPRPVELRPPPLKPTLVRPIEPVEELDAVPTRVGPLPSPVDREANIPTRIGPAPTAPDREASIPTRVTPLSATEAEATSTEIVSPGREEDFAPQTERPPPLAEAALAPTAERTSPSVVPPRRPSDDGSASHALSDQTHAGLRLDVSARLVERARALAPNLPSGMVRVQPVRETPEEAVLRAALAIGLASLAAIADSDDDA